MRGALEVADFCADLMRTRLEAQLRQVETANPRLTKGQLSSPRLISSTEPNWPLGIDQQPAVILTVRNAGSAVLQDVASDYETYDVTYEVAAEIYLTHPKPSVADMARYSWALAVRQVWLSARDLGGFSVLPGFTETYDTVVEDQQNAEWVTRALSVVQVSVVEKYATGRVITPVDTLQVQEDTVAVDEPFPDLPPHPAHDDSDDRPSDLT